MRIVCAWCRREGRSGFIGGPSGPGDVPETHGICAQHRERMLEVLPAPSFPDVQILLVVKRHEPRLYEYLAEALRGVRGVRVIMDRRRTGGEPPDPLSGPDPTHQRRYRRGQESLLGFTLLRFLRPEGPV